jgi:SAM-dependent methyltransferase
MDGTQEIQEINVEQIMARIRETLRERQSEFSSAEGPGLSSNGVVAADLASLQGSYDIYHIRFTSHRKGLGRLVVLAKQVLRKLLTPILERQLAYNAANTRIVHYLNKEMESLHQQQAATTPALQGMVVEQVQGLYQTVREMVIEQIQGLGQQQTSAFQNLREAMTAQIGDLGLRQTAALQGVRKALSGDLEKKVHDMRANVTAVVEAQQDNLARVEHRLAELVEAQQDKLARMAELEQTCLRLKTTLTQQERRLNMLLEEARKRLPAPFSQDQLHRIAEEERHALEALYLSFEEQFRGSPEDIRKRLEVYLPILAEAKLGTDEMPVLDVGCGRGEWLALLQEQGMRAQGVDVNRMVVDDCHQQGLEVVEGDAIAYLRDLPDRSLGAVTGFHVIEHLPFEGFVRLLDETVRVLKPGGVAIFETPNPENVLVGSYSFYLDPTHRHPLPSHMVRFMVEARGLCRVEVMYLHPSDEPRVEEAGLDVARRFNAYFYGPRDYAVIGRKV